jgi:hypothetical protein
MDERIHEATLASEPIGTATEATEAALAGLAWAEAFGGLLPDDGGKKHRITLDFSDQGFASFSALKDRTAAPSNAAVFRDSLALLEWLVDVQANGGQVQVQYPDGRAEAVTFVPSSAQPAEPAGATKELDEIQQDLNDARDGWESAAAALRDQDARLELVEGALVELERVATYYRGRDCCECAVSCGEEVAAVLAKLKPASEAAGP